jgi:hypothetical protein
LESIAPTRRFISGVEFFRGHASAEPGEIVNATDLTMALLMAMRRIDIALNLSITPPRYILALAADGSSFSWEIAKSTVRFMPPITSNNRG